MTAIPRGFPAPLPPGETLLWQGAPEWRVLARTALHTRSLLCYFAVLVLAASASGSVTGMLEAAGLGLVPLALAYLYAWMVARATVYSITDQRVVLHIGLALPVTLNLPLSAIASADIRAAADGSGDLSMALSGSGRFAYLVLWPHARPWRFSPAQPTMRGLERTEQPAKVLARALAASAGVCVPAVAQWQGETMQTPLAA